MSAVETILTRNPDVKPVPSRDDASEMRHLVHDIDYLITRTGINRIKLLSFIVNDIPFHVTHKKDIEGNGSLVCLHAVIGYLPFSIESCERRQAIYAIVDASHCLFHVRFGIDHNGRIFAAGNFAADTSASPNFVFYPLVQFLQEAQPYIDLIGEYL